MIYIDASLLKSSACQRHRYWTSSGWKHPSVGYKADFGTAIHKAMQHYYKAFGTYNNVWPSEVGRQLVIVEAIDKALAYWSPIEETAEIKQIDLEIYNEFSLKTILQEYFALYRSDSTIEILKDEKGEPLVEAKFRIPYSSNVEITGTIDLPCKYYGVPTIIDHKTFGNTDIQKKFDSYILDVQPLMYSWAWNKISGRDDYFPVVLNGFAIKKATSGKTPDAGKSVILARSQPIEFTTQLMLKFEVWLNEQIEEIERSYRANYGRPDFSSCNKGYPICQFQKICKHNVEFHEELLKTYFIKKEYNPLNFQD